MGKKTGIPGYENLTDTKIENQGCFACFGEFKSGSIRGRTPGVMLDFEEFSRLSEAVFGPKTEVFNLLLELNLK